ncbi:hypothetical protein M6B38_368720 [Iris pallida]|uniref:Translocon at the inner envelope membrane of chloroplasts 214 n=1 Tax=Iris pallida TaxID=29817 RepID=A0AAX6GFU2_IRIPA|nr:hypothetical protein M6B38_368720 [Iris pallida]
MSFIVYLFLSFYIWKVKKSSYNNREIEIEKTGGTFVMILQSFLLGNLLSLCMKIINLVVVVGLYYGFMTTFIHRALLSLPSSSSGYGRRNREGGISNN